MLANVCVCLAQECRCFISSLLSITSFNFNPTFPTLGLCYRMNCYKPDYLQVAIVDPFAKELFWYKCPPGGGKIYIPKCVCLRVCLLCVFMCVESVRKLVLRECVQLLALPV